MTTHDANISLIHTIVCDDIRREDNGKFILIGVYPEFIMLNMLPSQLILSIWMQFKMHRREKTILEFEIRGDAIQESMPFTMEIGDGYLFDRQEVIPLIVKLPFTIKAQGAFTIYYRREGDQEWSPAHTVRIKRNISPTLQ